LKDFGQFFFLTGGPNLLPINILIYHRFNPTPEFNTGRNPQQAGCYNLAMELLFIKRYLGLGIAVLVLAGCGAAQSQQTITPFKETYHLTLYSTTTPTPTPGPQDPGTATPFPTPSPTPRIHTIQSGETLLEIATQYGVSLEELLLANSEVNLSLLPVGLDLVIPGGSAHSANMEDIKPASLTILEQPCFSTGDGGAWCFALVKNEQESSVESVSLAMSILDQNGSEVSSRVTAAPLNLLHPGEVMPVGIYFSPPLPDIFHLGVKVVSALPYEDAQERYIPVTSVDSQETLAEDGMQAVINGTIHLQNSERLTQLSILAAGYAADGSLAAMRVWRSNYPQDSSSDIPFNMVLYSLGDEIDHVDILAEAKALQ
jgi:LysM repeat protein